mgnify:CR=1 FL=1
MAEPTLLPERLQYRPTKIELDESIEKAKATLLKKIKRSVYVYRVDCGGCNGCEIEIFATITAVFDAERFGSVFADERARREGQRQARCAYGRAALAREQGGRRQACPWQDGSWGRCGRWEVGGCESGESEGCRRRCERDERGYRGCC